MYEDPKSKISQLQKVLDAREDRVTGKARRHELHDHEEKVSRDWAGADFQVGHEVVVPVSVSAGENFVAPSKKSLSVATKILTGSIIFFLIAIIAVIYAFLGGGNIVSGNNIDIVVKAPVSVAGGEAMPFELDIKNNNNLTLAEADLSVVFPAGTTNSADTSVVAKPVQDFLGDILPGQTVKKNLSVALFGSENERKDITITLEYKVAGSNSLFNKIKTFSVLISSAPVSVVVSGPTQVNTNQTVDFSVDVVSNSPTVIKNLLLSVSYPFGFSYSGSSPKTFFSNNVWLIGDLAPGAKQTITFSGVLAGQEGEERGFNFSVGSRGPSDAVQIGTLFAKSFSSVTINRPFVSADISLNGVSTKQYVSSAGSQVETVIDWQNNLSYQVGNVSILVKLTGNAVDKSAVQVDGGFYRSADNTIVFDKTTDQTLASLEPGQTGESKFTFGSFGPETITGAALVNPTIQMDVSVSGNQVGFTGNQNNILFSDSRQVKITANPQLLAKALYFVGPFKNSGPVPPKSEQPTTYTVTWTITNPLNGISGATVSAILPPYIKWLGVVSSDQEKVDYDQNTGLVTWQVGKVSSGAGSLSSAREVSFQISFLPSVSQIGTTPNLIGDASLTGRDDFTLTPVSASVSALNTELDNDPYFPSVGSNVVQ